MDIECFGAIKIKDGLFIGDEFAAQDLEFVVTNKITHIINTSGRQVPNHWEPIGVRYLTYHWLDHESQIIYDQKDTVFNAIYSFINRAIQQAEGVLVHSVRGQSRSAIVITAYLMRRYQWSLQKTLEFMTQRRPDLDMKQGFLRQLGNLEARLTNRGIGPRTSTWDELSNENDEEETVLRNTFNNAQIGQIEDYNLEEVVDKDPDKIQWVDETGKSQNKTNSIESGFIKSWLKGSTARQEIILKSKPAPEPKHIRAPQEEQKRRVPVVAPKMQLAEPQKPKRSPIVSNSAKTISKSLDSKQINKVRSAPGTKKLIQAKKRPVTAGVRPPSPDNMRKEVTRPLSKGKKGKKAGNPGTTTASRNIYGLRL